MKNLLILLKERSYLRRSQVSPYPSANAVLLLLSVPIENLSFADGFQDRIRSNAPLTTHITRYCITFQGMGHSAWGKPMMITRYVLPSQI